MLWEPKSYNKKPNNQSHHDVRKTKYDEHERWFSNKTEALTHFFQGYGRSLKCSILVKSQGTSSNKLESKMTLEEASGMSKTAQKFILIRDRSLDALRNSKCLGLKWVRVPNGTNWSQRWSQKRHQGYQEQPKMLFHFETHWKLNFFVWKKSLSFLTIRSQKPCGQMWAITRVSFACKGF